MKTVSKIIAVIATVIVIAVIVGYIAGIRPYVISSDSMAPKYPKGSLTLINSRIRAEDIAIDDVIGIRVGNSLVFHRVGEIDREAGTALLYGDYQGKDVGTVVELNNSVLLGKEIMTVPGIGNVVGVLIGHGGVIAGVGAAVIALCLIPWERNVGKRKETATE